MANPNEEFVSTLNNLVETCKDGENGFRAAAEAVANPEIKSFFNNCARQRAQFARELQAEVRRLSGDPEETGSAAGSMHRGWINLKSAITGGDEKAIISECERGEDSAVKAYQEALDETTLPENLRSVIERQYRQVKEAHDRVRAMEVERAA